ncbi:MAG: ribonuclease III [Succinivibrionaceae bacterium]|jgi:ribonuclease-3|nr:ribonuclease III [Succinivibrionaceae bacterium]MBQ1425533.1 ribonuclease III [Succinivibrionaceae bacterium]
MTADFSLLEKKIGYKFKDLTHLKHALTHRSMGAVYNNERYEFFGDALLGVVISRHLFEKFPDADEGKLSRMRSSLVKETTLAEMANTIHLGDFLILGAGELKSGGFRRSSILADAMEAMICAIYIDSNHNLNLLDDVLTSWFTSRLDSISPEVQKDSKTKLQEYLQGRRLPLPEYKLFNVVGDNHKQSFTVTCRVSMFDELFTGIGTTKRKAEQDAASKVLAKIGE